MKVRDWMNNNSALVTILAVVVLVISLGVIIMQTRAPGAGGRTIDLYYYDLNTGKLFVGKSDEIPPIEAPSGPYQNAPGNLPAGVRAHVYACGECPDVTNMTAEEAQQAGVTIAYLEMYTPEGKAALTGSTEGEPSPEMMMDPMEHQLVRLPAAESRWVPAYSEPGYRLTEGAIPNCPTGEPAVPCRP